MKYSLDQELLINNLIKEKIQDLHQLLHEKKNVISDRQQENARRELKQYQELLYQNRLNRQIEVR
ncbi:hypothetical protein P7E08_13625 [Enterococcus gallinarum]|uniref:hypothetical protein n=1 Tax=Enterococcus gallinarum TaxID=1353 RepID=UPI0028914AFB|nr:hypothetical protein [Enterococcus gallinarum]MDT2701327.1 hypothetical protein [Enterococcus gallinarum]MDT2727940.1 hypothetical protein [Enterococcus gallinarum]